MLLRDALHPHGRFLYRCHLFRPFHAPPFTNFFPTATATYAKLSVQLAQRNAGIFNVLGDMDSGLIR